MEPSMRAVQRYLALVALFFAICLPPAMAQETPQPAHPSAGPGPYGPGELLDAGHRFFGGVSRGLATIIERAVSQWGLPNGYVLGEEAGGAFFGGLRYGEGTLYT